MELHTVQSDQSLFRDSRRASDATVVGVEAPSKTEDMLHTVSLDNVYPDLHNDVKALQVTENKASSISSVRTVSIICLLCFAQFIEWALSCESCFDVS